MSTKGYEDVPQWAKDLYNKLIDDYWFDWNGEPTHEEVAGRIIMQEFKKIHSVA